MCVLYRERTWRRPDSHVLCVPRRGFPRFAIPESRWPFLSPTKTRAPRRTLDWPKAKIIDSSHVFIPPGMTTATIDCTLVPWKSSPGIGVITKVPRASHSKHLCGRRCQASRLLPLLIDQFCIFIRLFVSIHYLYICTLNYITYANFICLLYAIIYLLCDYLLMMYLCIIYLYIRPFFIKRSKNLLCI